MDTRTHALHSELHSDHCLIFADTPKYVEAMGVPDAKDEKQENVHIPMYPTFKN